MTSPLLQTANNDRRGAALIGVLLLVMIAGLIVTSMVMWSGRDHIQTGHNLQTLRAFYAAEAGLNMAVREVAANSDEDGDGTIGTISDDGNDANDPAVGDGQVVVTSTTDGGVTTLVSRGRSGESRREIEADVLTN